MQISIKEITLYIIVTYKTNTLEFILWYYIIITSLNTNNINTVNKVIYI